MLRGREYFLSTGINTRIGAAGRARELEIAAGRHSAGSGDGAAPRSFVPYAAVTASASLPIDDSTSPRPCRRR